MSSRLRAPMATAPCQTWVLYWRWWSERTFWSASFIGTSAEGWTRRVRGHCSSCLRCSSGSPSSLCCSTQLSSTPYWGYWELVLNQSSAVLQCLKTVWSCCSTRYVWLFVKNEFWILNDKWCGDMMLDRKVTEWVNQLIITDRKMLTLHIPTRSVCPWPGSLWFLKNCSRRHQLSSALRIFWYSPCSCHSSIGREPLDSRPGTRFCWSWQHLPVTMLWHIILPRIPTSARWVNTLVRFGVRGLAFRCEVWVWRGCYYRINSWTFYYIECDRSL